MTKSVHEMYQEIKAIEVKELKDAVIAKGGKYVFEEEHEPIVMINKFDSPCDAVIESVTVDDRGFLTMSAHDKECCQDVFTLFADEVAYGHIDFITNEIR